MYVYKTIDRNVKKKPPPPKKWVKNQLKNQKKEKIHKEEQS